MNRIDYINKITACAARFVYEVEGFNAANQYHINIHAENFLIPILDEVFGLELENLNATRRKNYPAIDVADFGKRIAFQITATGSTEKIKHTLEAFASQSLNEYFDTLYIYILTEKKEKYPEEKIKPFVPAGLAFNWTEHVIDRGDILHKINQIKSTTKLERLARLFEHEFSDAQIETRKTIFAGGYLDPESEQLQPNFVEVIFPERFFLAKLDVDEDAITQKINEDLQRYGKKPRKRFRKEKLVRRALKTANALCEDWVLHEGNLLTFRNLTVPAEGLRKIIDIGTVTEIGSTEYYSIDEVRERVFKSLLRSSLRELCKRKDIEWFGKKKVFRFANHPKEPNSKQVKWKGKRESTKTVIFKMINKKEGHTICFRSLAFRASFLNINTKWYLMLNPTWSFTDPGGYKTSRFEPSYMSGLKRLENNKSVYYYFLFFCYYLSFVDLFTADYPYLKIKGVNSLDFSPRVNEEGWLPVKSTESVVRSIPTEIDIDTELNETLF